MAYLHKKEQVLNAKDTENLYKTIDIVRELFGQVKSASINGDTKKNKSGNQIGKMEFNFNNFTGTKREAEDATDYIMKALYKNGVMGS